MRDIFYMLQSFYVTKFMVTRFMITNVIIIKFMRNKVYT
jgi:hypothetical protein